MSFKFRSRTFLYLLVLLGLFVASQATIYTAVEWAHRHANPYESLREGMEEVVQGVGLTLLLVPILAAVAWWLSLADRGQPHDRRRRDVPLRIFRHGHVFLGLSGLLRGLHAGVAAGRHGRLQPRGADVHGYGVARMEDHRPETTDQRLETRDWRP